MPKVYIESEQFRNKVLEMLSILEEQYKAAKHKLTDIEYHKKRADDAFAETKAELNMCIEQKSALMAILSLIDEFEKR